MTAHVLRENERIDLLIRLRQRFDELSELSLISLDELLVALEGEALTKETWTLLENVRKTFSYKTSI
jgi:hypothetical protein